jgi:hypothetical protein
MALKYTRRRAKLFKVQVQYVLKEKNRPFKIPVMYKKTQGLDFEQYGVC